MTNIDEFQTQGKEGKNLHLPQLQIQILERTTLTELTK